MAGYKFHNGRRWIGGTAALLRQVNKDGGLIPHYMKTFALALEMTIHDRNVDNGSPARERIREEKERKAEVARRIKESYKNLRRCE